MFTGIIEEIGKVAEISDYKIKVNAEKVLQNTKPGDSISVNGVCLTVTDIQTRSFSADISPETRRVSSLKYVKIGSFVNLERALMLGDRLGGHIVSGHVDGAGKVKSVNQSGDFYEFEIELNKPESDYVVKKGSITVNGISLTVADIDGKNIKLAVIPHTFENTNLKTLQSGDYVNIETDILSKYVEKFLSTSDNKSGISMEFLQENGF